MLFRSSQWLDDAGDRCDSLGFHFLGWVFVLLGSAGWSSRQFPRLLCAFYFLAGSSAWFVYLLPELEGLVLLLGAVAGIWQGVLLWKAAPSR